MLLLRVIDVKYLQDYQLQLSFNDGTTKMVDLESELSGPIFEPLRDKLFFRQVKVNPETNTIEWPNGADFAPEFLQEIGEEIVPKSTMTA